MNNIQKQILEQCLLGSPEGTLREVRAIEDLPLDVTNFLEDHNEGDSLLEPDAPLWDQIEIYIHNHYREQRRYKRRMSDLPIGGSYD